MVQWGNVAEWFAAVGTVSAVVVSLYLTLNERRLRRNERLHEQAYHVAVWAEWQRQIPSNVNPRQWFAYATNASSSPIHCECLSASPHEGEKTLMDDDTMGTIAPHDMINYALNEADFPPNGDAPFVELRFRDVHGLRWICNSKGDLTLIPSPRTALPADDLGRREGLHRPEGE